MKVWVWGCHNSTKAHNLSQQDWTLLTCFPMTRILSNLHALICSKIPILILKMRDGSHLGFTKTCAPKKSGSSYKRRRKRKMKREYSMKKTVQKRRSLKKKKKNKENQPLSPLRACRDDWELYSNAYKSSNDEQHALKMP